jgi:UDP-N-acetylglucosamine 2-epimerase (non-hydrolysing)
MKKILLVFGTRPEAIKLAPLFRELKEYPKFFNVRVCVTAQHREMLDQVLCFFGITPDIDLNIMTKEQSLSQLTSNVLLSINNVLAKEKPDILLVHGDTTTTFASALSAFYLGIDVGHIEAGLRTHNMAAPFPEEFNRKIVSNIAKWHFTPTNISKNNLLKEGLASSKIWVTGNTIIDSLYIILKRFSESKDYSATINKNLTEILNFDLKKKKFILVTGHRRENFGRGFQSICQSLKELSNKYPSINFVYPAHLNPNVIEPVKSILKGLENVKIIKPLNYDDFIYLLKYSYAVLTDSGGLQEEASSLGIPVLVMRDTTERPEAIGSGILNMVGTDQLNIINKVSELIEDEKLYNKIAISNNVYGDGLAAKRIVETLRSIK